MNTYSARLHHAMACRQMNPAKDQTHLARLVGNGCSPQVIQHLLDPNKNARSSKYTPMLAAVLRCDTVWLATGNGPAPTAGTDQNPPTQATASGASAPHVSEPMAVGFWPWSISPERIAALPPDFFGRLDGYIEGRVEEYERAHPPHQALGTAECTAHARKAA